MSEKERKRKSRVDEVFKKWLPSPLISQSIDLSFRLIGLHFVLRAPHSMHFRLSVEREPCKGFAFCACALSHPRFQNEGTNRTMMLNNSRRPNTMHSERKIFPTVGTSA
jgi:hypothetical protein